MNVELSINAIDRKKEILNSVQNYEANIRSIDQQNNILEIFLPIREI